MYSFHSGRPCDGGIETELIELSEKTDAARSEKQTPGRFLSGLRVDVVVLVSSGRKF